MPIIFPQYFAAVAPATQTGTYIFPNGEKYGKKKKKYLKISIVIQIIITSCSDGEYTETNPGQIERNGMGTHQSADGMTYTGQWIRDKMNGRGKIIAGTRVKAV